MESFRNQRSPGADYFLGLFSQPSPPDGTISPIAGGDELDEDEIFWTDSPSNPSSMSSTHPNPNPNPRSSVNPTGLRRFPESFGILAALLDEDKKRPILQRKPVALSSLTETSPSSSLSFTSSTRMIPAIPKSKVECAMSVQGGMNCHQSMPVKVPMVPPRVRRGWAEFDRDVRVAEDAEEEEMLPPHEIVARASSKESPLTTFSMLEGAGRTLKGRDLRRVRNAVWRQTGFLD